MIMWLMHDLDTHALTSFVCQSRGPLGQLLDTEPGSILKSCNVLGNHGEVRCGDDVCTGLDVLHVHVPDKIRVVGQRVQGQTRHTRLVQATRARLVIHARCMGMTVMHFATLQLGQGSD